MKETNITIDGKNFVFEKLPKKIRDMLELHQIWNADLMKLRTEVAKNEMAISRISEELSSELAAMDNNDKPQ